MRKLEVYRNGILAGILMEEDRNQYTFHYDNGYYNDSNAMAISLTLPKSQMEYHSEFLFPFFFNMLSEGVNKKLQCQQLRIDEEDYMGLLMATAQYETIGPITVMPLRTE